jgi:alpha/beta superfamily hydrolase
MSAPKRIEFTGSQGHTLAARLDDAIGPERAVALFAHCFTCSKDIAAARRIAGTLAKLGITVLRFDFTGLGHSDGEFANTNFFSNVGDLLAAAQWLRENRRAPSLLVGHSLGGAAVLAAAPDIPECRAVATIGAPSDPAHIAHLFGSAAEEIRSAGEAEVTLAGRRFKVQRQLLDDIAEQELGTRLRRLRAAVMLFHSPIDDIVGIDNAAQLFALARHPKSFVSLDDADHMLSRPEDAAYVAEVLGAWISRYLPN